MAAKDRHKANIIKYLSDCDNEWPTRTEIATKVLGFKKQTLWCIFSSAELDEIEGEALEILVGYAYGQNDIFGNNYGLLSPMKHNAYGPGIHSDATGRPFKFKTFDGQDVEIFDVKPNAYGPGVSMDEFGRPVCPVPFNQFGH